MSLTDEDSLALLDLPFPIVEDVAQLSGLGCREACKLLECAFGSLSSVRPDHVISHNEMQRALQRLGRHARLSALDLTHVGRFISDDEVLQFVNCFRQLQHLRVVHPAGLTNTGLLALTNLSLSRLEVHNCESFDLQSLATVANITSLRHLNIQFSRDQRWKGVNTELHCITNLQQLTHLQVAAIGDSSRPSCIHHLLSSTANLPNLSSLDLVHSVVFPLTSTAARLLGRHTGLRHLALLLDDGYEDENLPELCEILTSLTFMKQLDHLNLDIFTNAPPETVVASLSPLPLTSLQLTTDIMPALHEVLPGRTLTQLQLACTQEVPSAPETLDFLALQRNSLKTLHLTYFEMTPELVSTIFTLTRVEALSLTFRGTEHHPGLWHGIDNLTNLRDLALNCHLPGLHLYDYALPFPAHLRSLTLMSCNFRSSEFASLSALTQLEFLSITDNAADHSADATPGIRVLYDLRKLKEVCLDLRLAGPLVLQQYLCPPPEHLCRMQLVGSDAILSGQMAQECEELLRPFCEVICRL